MRYWQSKETLIVLYKRRAEGAAEDRETYYCWFPYCTFARSSEFVLFFLVDRKGIFTKRARFSSAEESSDMAAATDFADNCGIATLLPLDFDTVANEGLHRDRK